MTAQQILFGKQAQRKLAAGADKLARAVISTLGPRSRNVALNREWPAPLVTHDGVTVASSIRLKDPFEDMGAVLLREAASKTNELAGDGTTTATLLANTLVQEGMKMLGVTDDLDISINKPNPMELKEELEKLVPIVVEKLEKRAVKIKKKEKYQQVATVSSGSEEGGKLVADAIEKVGEHGIVFVERGPSFDSSIETREGMQFDNGYLSPYFMNNPNHFTAEYKESYVLFTDMSIVDPRELRSIIEQVMKEGGKPLLIVAADVTGPALQHLVKWKTQDNIPLVAVVAPGWIDTRKQMLEDMAILTGGNVISSDLGQKVSDVKIKDLGRLKHMSVSSISTSFSPLNPDKEEVKERIEAIRAQIDQETNQLRKNKLNERLGKLSNGVVVINVGGASETEIDEKYRRIEDAVYATKAALAEGIVPGAGTALFDIAVELGTPNDSPATQLLIKMLKAPYLQILENAGEDIEKISFLIECLPDTVKNRGYDTVKKRAGNLIELGIIDPVKVTRLAFVHAVSVACAMLTTEVLVSPEEETGVQKMEIISR